MSSASIRAVGILIKKDRVFLIYWVREGKRFWVFSGGGVEKDEKVETAVTREICEEASIKCRTVKLLYAHQYLDINQKQHYYLCRYISGAPKFGNFNELHTMKNEDQIYRPEWIEIRKMSKMLVYPLEIRDWVIKDCENEFKDTPKKVMLNTEDLRQQF